MQKVWGGGKNSSLVNRFVERHDSLVEIESTNGTLVRCHLPRRIHDEPPASGEERMTA